jgi:hypothetical protein
MSIDFSCRQCYHQTSLNQLATFNSFIKYETNLTKMEERMKKGLPILTALTLVIITSSAWAGTQTWTFDAGAADWEAANGTWEVNGGVYQEVSGGEAAMHTLVGDVAWDNYTVEAKVRLDEGNWAGVIFRAQNEFEYYVFYLNVPDNKTEFWRHKQGAFDDFHNRISPALISR